MKCFVSWFKRKKKYRVQGKAPERAKSEQPECWHHVGEEQSPTNRMKTEHTEQNAWERFKLLMWKNSLQQVRRRGQTAAEMLVPIVAMALVLIIRWQVEPVRMGVAKYPKIRAHALNFSLQVLYGMNFSKLSVAYSPKNDLLEEIVRNALHKLIHLNDELIKKGISKQIKLPNLNVVNQTITLPNNVSGVNLPWNISLPNNITLPPSMTLQDFLATLIRNEILKGLLKVIAYNKSADLNTLYSKEEQTRIVLCAIEFDDSWQNITELPDDISYSLRFPERPRLNSFYSQGARSWKTDMAFPTFQYPGPRHAFSWEGGNEPGYTNELFIAVMHMVSMELIMKKTGQNLSNFDINLQRYPHPPYVQDFAVQTMQMLFPMFIMLSFSYTAVNLVRAITVEKELELKEAMKIMGLPTWLHWTAWFCKQFIYLIIVIIMIVIIVKVHWFSTENGFNEYAVFTYTSWHVLFAFLTLYLISTILFCFMMSGMFSKANTASLFTGVFWFLSYVPAFLVSLDVKMPILVQVLTCLSVNTAMAYGFTVLLAHESSGGLKWDEFFYVPSVQYSRLLFGHILMMLIFNSILYMLITLYLEQVLPGPFGSPQKWNFLFQKSYWMGSPRIDDVQLTETQYEDRIVKEKDPTGHDVGVKIVNLTKIYGANTVVDNLSLNIFNDQITVLLGHNGAGKSTTISMITGNVRITRGTVSIAGYDITKQTRGARARLGLCTQHNVLFNELTVHEHLEFFSRIKGMKGEAMYKEIDSLIKKLELESKRNYKSAGLSGGQKRRLQVGIALCGGTSVVLLDEPTSGMDPASRRALWDLLQKEKEGRSMILTTHFMDEADILGDRIAIMAAGRLQCVGSPYFLKQYYGVGYTLVVVKTEGFNGNACTELLKKYIPGTVVKEDRGTEVTYSLTNEYAQRFEEMLTDLERNKGRINYNSYGLVATTLEDVFMAVGSDVHGPNSDSNNEENAAAPTSPDSPGQYPCLCGSNGQPDRSNRTGHCMYSDPELYCCEIHRDGIERCDVNPMPCYCGNGNIIETGNKTIGDGANLDGSELDYNKDSIQEIKGKQLIWNHILAVWMKLYIVWTRSWTMVLLQILAPILLINSTLVMILYGSKSTETIEKKELTLAQGFRKTETLLYYAGTSLSTIGANAGAAYESIFMKSGVPGMKLTIADSPMHEHYLERAKNPADMAYIRDKILIGATFENNEAIAWFSNFGYHDSPTSLAYVHSAILRSLCDKCTLTVYNYPLQAHYANQDDLQLLMKMLSTLLANGIANSIGVVSAMFVVFYIKERTTRAKLLQKASGIRPIVMWGGAAVFDWVWFLIINVPILLSCVIFQVIGLSTFVELFRVLILLMVYGMSMLPLVYLSSYFFNGPGVGFVALFFANVILGMMAPQIVESLWSPQYNTKRMGDLIDGLLQFYPLYSLVTSVRTLNQIGIIEHMCFKACDFLMSAGTITECTMPAMCKQFSENCCIPVNPHWDWESPGVMRYVLVMILSGFFVWGLLMMAEYRLLQKKFYKERKPPPIDESKLDDDVLAEMKRVQKLGKGVDEPTLVANGISKYYGNYLAVNQVSFTVSGNECFGLLGVNGAGKTTTFKMLMGDETMSSGDAFVVGHSVKTDINKVYENIGYCPQFDAVFNEMTGRETMKFFSMLRGLQPSNAAMQTLVLARALGFVKHLDKRTDQYSGGNRRKLSTAIALLGRSRLIFVDEPTTGIDPAARRQVWTAIQEARRNGRGVVLTSHSMEECEALCSRLTVMVNGGFQCLGTPQHLKTKFSQGFTLTIKLKVDEKTQRESIDFNTKVIKNYVRENFTDSKIVEEYQGLITYYLPDTGMPWSRMFGLMEYAKRELHVEDYSISQTTLEQVFLQFTKYQKDDQVTENLDTGELVMDNEGDRKWWQKRFQWLWRILNVVRFNRRRVLGYLERLSGYYNRVFAYLERLIDVVLRWLRAVSWFCRRN